MAEHKEVLYAGLDETNHRQFPELWVAVFSFDQEDIIKKKPRRFRLEGQDLERAMQGRGYRFLTISREDSEYLGKNLLARVAVSLITEVRLHTYADRLELRIDGRATLLDKKAIRETLPGFPGGMNIMGIRKIPPNYKYPNILTLADGLAYKLHYQTPKDELVRDHRRVHLI